MDALEYGFPSCSLESCFTFELLQQKIICISVAVKMSYVF